MDWITNLDDPRVQTALGWSCDVCGAKPGQTCTNPITPTTDLPGRIVHLARLVDRRRHA